MPKSKVRKGRGPGPRPKTYRLEPQEVLRQIGHGEVGLHEAKIMAEFLLRTANFTGVAPNHIEEFRNSGVENWPPETTKDIIALARAAYPKPETGTHGNQGESASTEAPGSPDQQGERGTLSRTSN